MPTLAVHFSQAVKEGTAKEVRAFVRARLRRESLKSCCVIFPRVRIMMMKIMLVVVVVVAVVAVVVAIAVVKHNSNVKL